MNQNSHRHFVSPVVRTGLQRFAERQREREAKRDAMKPSHCAYTAKVRAKEKAASAAQRGVAAKRAHIVPFIPNRVRLQSSLARTVHP